MDAPPRDERSRGLRSATKIVSAGYDAMAVRYGQWAAQIDDEPRRRYTADLLARLAPGSQILDLGCGAGVPSTIELARRHEVHGVDISSAQLALARENVPDATFELADLSTLDRADASCDAVTAFYSLSHVPRDEHAALLARIRRWLRPGGWLLATLSAAGLTDCVQDDFVGVPMFFSGFDAETNRGVIVAAGFDLVADEVATIHEPDGDATFLWVLARAAS